VTTLLFGMTWPLAIVQDTDAARTAVGVIAVLTLLAVLVVREMARAGVRDLRTRRVEDLRFITWPLTIVFVAVIGPRILDLLK
jgi:hypothetical protein